MRYSENEILIKAEPPEKIHVSRASDDFIVLHRYFDDYLTASIWLEIVPTKLGAFISEIKGAALALPGYCANILWINVDENEYLKFVPAKNEMLEIRRYFWGELIGLPILVPFAKTGELIRLIQEKSGFCA